MRPEEKKTSVFSNAGLELLLKNRPLHLDQASIIKCQNKDMGNICQYIRKPANTQPLYSIHNEEGFKPLVSAFKKLLKISNFAQSKFESLLVTLIPQICATELNN